MPVARKGIVWQPRSDLVAVTTTSGRMERGMGLIHIDLFTTLDGVAQAPGGPEEDAEGGFAFGGWQAPLFDEVVGEQVGSGMVGMDALLLGRRTYDIFAAYWPNVGEGADTGIAGLFNRLPKYVASRHPRTLEWADSTLLGPDVVAAVRELRDRHANIHVIGSLDFVQTLFAERLFDRLTLWVYPILLGSGKKVFADGVVPTNLRLIEPVVTSPKGAVLQRYALADGTPGVGDMSAGDQEP
jgi:dihydrofolate reductase